MFKDQTFQLPTPRGRQLEDPLLEHGARAEAGAEGLREGVFDETVLRHAAQAGDQRPALSPFIAGREAASTSTLQLPWARLARRQSTQSVVNPAQQLAPNTRAQQPGRIIRPHQSTPR